jgi:hypothetical protein
MTRERVKPKPEPMTVSEFLTACALGVAVFRRAARRAVWKPLPFPFETRARVKSLRKIGKRMKRRRKRS